MPAMMRLLTIVATAIHYLCRINQLDVLSMFLESYRYFQSSLNVDFSIFYRTITCQ